MNVKTEIQELTAHELTIKEQRELMQKAAAKAEAAQQEIPEIDPVAYLVEDMTLAEMALICRCDEDFILNLTETEVSIVAKCCKKANPIFFEKRAVTRKQAQDMMSQNPDMLREFLSASMNKSKLSNETQPH